ncbi:XdhC family protein [Georgenia satyanarayanai]|uniref:XdhC family protein n=1 Tax=Georgenia satyanarayanai TaxID=860221 RepID=UPI00203D2424|nr:XdhC/CoxI family protein [Georgenia satyanarayanai]MCM3660624.1 XdhC family protein [Georgenia satyanarayanai]
MLSIVEELQSWRGRYALATVVDVERSAPRRPGAAMAMSSTGAVQGSVSVGCIESDLFARCEQVLADGQVQTVRYGVGDDLALGPGMTCGGEIEVFIQRLDPADLDLRAVVEARRSQSHAALVTELDGSAAGRVRLVRPDGWVEPREQRAWDLAREAGADGTVIVAGRRLFVELITPRPRLIVIGAVDFAGAIADVASLVGFHVTVCDARPAFATAERFRSADEVVAAWPQQYLADIEIASDTAICVITHDARFDEPVIEVAIRSPAGYIGVMGSRRTHHDRLDRLRRRGLGDEDLARLHSPIGLDLGGITPHETAVSVVAEIIATRRRGSGVPLGRSGGPIHRDRSVSVEGSRRLGGTRPARRP